MVHIAIIMDGNGRWAKEKGKSRIEGHEAGLHAFRQIAMHAANLPAVTHLTVYAFSVQNWSRPVSEIKGLFGLAKQYFSELELFQNANICLRVQGSLDLYPREVQTIIQTAIQTTEKNTGLVLTLALSYGGREEIVEAAEKIRLSPGNEPMTQERFGAILNPEQIPDPDLIIRTSGEFRVSNFLLWQGSYSEYLILDKFWPDFTSADLDAALSCLAKRERRYGKIANETDTLTWPSESGCKECIHTCLTSAKTITVFSNLQKYKQNQVLFAKYQEKYRQAIAYTPNNDYQLCTESFLTAVPDFTDEMKSWISWIIFAVWLESQCSLTPHSLHTLIRQTSGVLDLYRCLRHACTIQESTEEHLKEKLISLTDFHREIYKQLIQTKEESPILSTVYGLYPVLYRHCSIEDLCSLACLIHVLFYPDLSYPSQEQMCEYMASQDNGSYSNIAYYAKLKTALVYLSLFTGAKGVQSLHWSQIVQYIQLSLQLT